MAKRKKNKSTFSNILIYLSIFFCVVLFVIKVLFNNINWISVFTPIIIAFVIIFVISILKKLIQKF